MKTWIGVLAWGVGGLLCACGSGNARQETADSAGNAGSGAQSHGGAPGTGGAHADGGSRADGGANAAGNAGRDSAGGTNNATGGVGGAGMKGCHQASECPNTSSVPFAMMLCLNPGEPAPSPGCGAAQWCGQCNCPPQPATPLGNGMSCQTSADCPHPNAASATASVCNAGLCTACTQDSDCPSALPHCGSVTVQFGSSFRLCTACGSDTDCPSERPHCQGVNALPACVACRSSADCASGVCSDGSCTPQCNATMPCGTGMQCNAQQRCEAVSCQSDTDCMLNQACTMGHCARRTCTTDASCQGACVNGNCYDSLGSCYVYLQAA